MSRIKNDGIWYYIITKSEGKLYLPRWKDHKGFLYYFVQWLIIFSVIMPFVFSNNGKFKIGDRVKYNWKANIKLKSIVEKRENIRIVSKALYKDKGNVEFTNGDSCACFWIRKCYFWE